MLKCPGKTLTAWRKLVNLLSKKKIISIGHFPSVNKNWNQKIIESTVFAMAAVYMIFCF